MPQVVHADYRTFASRQSTVSIRFRLRGSVGLPVLDVRPDVWHYLFGEGAQCTTSGRSGRVVLGAAAASAR